MPPTDMVFRNERAILQMLSNVESRVRVLEATALRHEQEIRELKARGGSGNLDGVNAKLDLLLLRSEMALQQGDNIMATAQELEQVLNDVDQQTNQIADTLTAQTPILNEIDADIDALLTRGTEPIPQPLLERFQLHRTRLQGLNTTIAETSTRLTATAAKHPVADPPPVEEPPVENPPVENPPTENPVS